MSRENARPLTVMTQIRLFGLDASPIKFPRPEISWQVINDSKSAHDNFRLLALSISAMRLLNAPLLTRRAFNLSMSSPTENDIRPPTSDAPTSANVVFPQPWPSDVIANAGRFPSPEINVMKKARINCLSTSLASRNRFSRFSRCVKSPSGKLSQA